MKRIAPIPLAIVVGFTMFACGSEQALTPTLTPALTIIPSTTAIEVDPDDDLAEIIENAPSGATISIGPGTYVLAESLDIYKPVHLIGAGMDQTEIVSEAEHHVMGFAGAGSSMIEDITFRHTGSATAAVVIAARGEITFSRCRFTGAFRNEGEGNPAALFFTQGAIGVVQYSEIVDNDDATGIIIDLSTVTLENNTIQGSFWCVLFTGTGGGTARFNSISDCPIGIDIRSPSTPTIENNEIFLCAMGISVYDAYPDLESLLEDNQFHDNVGHVVTN
jgi:hypothetical protein